jgi:hypothetical protein
MERAACSSVTTHFCGVLRNCCRVSVYEDMGSPRVQVRFYFTVLNPTTWGSGLYLPHIDFGLPILDFGLKSKVKPGKPSHRQGAKHAKKP